MHGGRGPPEAGLVYYLGGLKTSGANSPDARAFFATTGEKGMPVPRPGQYRGGLLGWIEYSFWGDPVPPGEKRTRPHVPIAGDIAQTSAACCSAPRPS